MSDSAPIKPDDGDDLDQDPRVADAVQEYMQARESGRKLSRQELIARNPEIAADLSACLQGLSFLESAAGQIESDVGLRTGTHDARIEEALSSHEPLGDFKLLREIGRGGMGVVYEAQQLSLGRRVALKVLPLASALDPRQLQRFRNEAQAAAQLHHSNIVPVYAVGSERSVHFYAMQLIEGQSLSEVIRGLKNKSTAPRGKSNSTALIQGNSEPATLHAQNRRAAYHRFVAQLGVQAARALQYAHEIGIVHRDVKPGNLLLDTRGHLWVADFGLAQMYAETGQTRTGDTPGTFRYMSPEQATGRSAVLDQRTDIYSLAVTLYELLTLRPAVPDDSREEMMRQITSVDPPSPRLVDREVPAELETILAKAMAKDADERYFTAGGMADDLDRFLRDEPILARPPTAWDKGLKWIKRHKSFALTSIAALAFVSVGLTVSTVMLAQEQARTREANALERQQSLKAYQQSLRAEKNFSDARTAVDFMTNIAANEIPNDPGLVAVRQRLLQSSLDYYQKFIDSGQSGDDLTAAKARVSALLAQIVVADELVRMNLRWWIASQPTVQRELHLTQDQKKKLSALASHNWFDDDTSGPPPMGGPDERNTTAAQIKTREKTLKETLTTAQFERLQQISRQMRGLGAFRDPDVAAALALTPDQTAALLAAQAKLNEHSHGGGPGPRHANPEDRAAAVREVVSKLDPHQTQVWQQLTGPSIPVYWFDELFRGPGGRGGRGGPFGGDGPPPGN
jgi:serine/threonine protein kinase